MNTLYGFCRCRMCLCAMLLCLMFAILPLSARADEASAQPRDSTKSTAVTNVGSITILLTEDADGSKSTMRGGQISLYCVGLANRDDPNVCFYDTSRGQFATFDAVDGIENMTKDQLDAQNPSISEALVREIDAKGVKPLQTVNVSNGQVTFPKVEEGLYLLVQTKPSDDGRVMRSFIISVPNDEGNLDVVATPKPGIQDGDGDDATPAKDSATKPNAESTTESTTPANTTPATVQPASVNNRVPATNDRLLLVVPMALSGLFLLFVGIVAHRRVGARS